MKRKSSYAFFYPVLIGLLLAVSTSSAFAQSQALNGQIEGTILDQAGAAVPNAVVEAANIQTGFVRNMMTDESGIYRMPLLPLGTYRISVEAPTFKKQIQEGITLTTGQTATVDLYLTPGEMVDVVTVSADTSVADAGKTDLGRVLNTREVRNLPLIQRNPYNFGRLQANVNGRVQRGFAFPVFNVNGYARRVNYQIDGNTNTQGDRPSIRLMLISETFVSEIQLVTNAFAAEFGNTPGMIMNVITPSGTNRISGAVSYLFRRPKFYSRPFFYPAANDLPSNKANIFTAAVGAPVIRDRWHFYFGYEYQYREDKAAAQRLLTIAPTDRADLIAAGLSPAIFPVAIPSLDEGAFYIFRSDLQLTKKNRLTWRFNHSDLISDNLLSGGRNTLERGFETFTIDYGLAVQLASYTPKTFNELRFQYAQRASGNRRNEFSGSGPSIVIRNVANFGSPTTDTVFPPFRVTQFQDNLTRTTGAHVVKIGGGVNLHNHTEREGIASTYTFLTVADYVAARNGSSPRSYSNYSETFGDPEINYKATFWNFFAQDDWKLTRRLKISYGLRYDLYQIPKANATSPFPASRKFNVDKNNFAPRFGIVYALREGSRPTILRAGMGIYYDQPPLAMYRRALHNNGNPRFFSVNFTPNQINPPAPTFPNTFSGSALPTFGIQDIDAIAPDFVNMYAVYSNVQLEQALTENLSLAVGYVRSAGRHIPVYRQINCLPTGETLADGRPRYGTFNPITGALISPCARRIFSQFRNIQMVESVGNSNYDALTLQLAKRFSRGLQFSANYTLSKATDDAPEQNLTTGNIQGLVLSDPTNRRLDKGNSLADQRHTFVMSLVAHPQFNIANKTLRRIFNDNQIGVIATANSGERFNIVTDFDLNGDGIFGAVMTNSDRPVGIRRNSGKTPPQYNVDFRYSRFFNFTDRYKFELFAEFQNLFNTNSIVGFTRVTVDTNAAGELIGALPDFKARNQSTAQDSRQFQLGFKFIF